MGRSTAEHGSPCGSTIDLVRSSLQCYRLQFDRDDVEDFWLDQQFEQLQTALEQAWSMEWLLAEIPTSGTTRISGHGELNVVEEFQKLISAQVTANYVAKPLRVKCIMLLHLFSGHRRTGDVQHAFEQLQPTSMFPMMGLSVDVVISLQFGNMLDPRTQRLFLTAVRDGLIGAIVAGPPCESWSQAREQYYREQRGPRPIRTVQSPQGMEQLRLREITQLIVWETICLERRCCLPIRLGFRAASCSWSIRGNHHLHTAHPYGSSQ